MWRKRQGAVPTEDASTAAGPSGTRPAAGRPRPVPPGATVGSALRTAREERGIPLQAVSLETKIGQRLLEAIEREDFAALPGGIFNRAFIRAFARQVDLDGEALVALYERSQSRAERPARRSFPSQETLLIGGGVVLALLLAVGIWLVWSHLGS